MHQNNHQHLATAIEQHHVMKLGPKKLPTTSPYIVSEDYLSTIKQFPILTTNVTEHRILLIDGGLMKKGGIIYTSTTPTKVNVLSNELSNTIAPLSNITLGTL